MLCKPKGYFCSWAIFKKQVQWKCLIWSLDILWNQRFRATTKARFNLRDIFWTNYFTHSFSASLPLSLSLFLSLSFLSPTHTHNIWLGRVLNGGCIKHALSPLSLSLSPSLPLSSFALTCAHSQNAHNWKRHKCQLEDAWLYQFPDPQTRPFSLEIAKMFISWTSQANVVKYTNE